MNTYRVDVYAILCSWEPHSPARAESAAVLALNYSVLSKPVSWPPYFKPSTSSRALFYRVRWADRIGVFLNILCLFSNKIYNSREHESDLRASECKLPSRRHVRAFITSRLVCAAGVTSIIKCCRGRFRRLHRPVCTRRPNRQLRTRQNTPLLTVVLYFARIIATVRKTQSVGRNRYAKCKKFIIGKPIAKFVY